MPAPEPSRHPFTRHEVVLVVLLLVAAALLRFANLAGAPPGLFRDELEKGYTAYELWHTGRHGFLGEQGIELSPHLPPFIEVYAGHDRTSAIYQYVSAPVVGIFGLSRFTTRFAAAAIGLLTVALAWLFARHRWGVGAGVIACAILAFHPTAIIFSRWAQQGVFVPYWTLLGFLLLSHAEADVVGRNRRALAGAGGLALGLAAYSYDPARLVVPALLGLWMITREGRPADIARRHVWVAAAFLAVWLPLAYFTLGVGGGRLGRVSLFGEGIGAGLAKLPGQYGTHFSPDFWLISGDPNARHRLPANGFAGAGMTLLMMGGVLLVVKRIATREAASVRDGLFLVGWLLAAPLAAAVTLDAPHALRANLLIPPVALLAAWGWRHADMTCGLRGLSHAAVGVLLLFDAGRSALGVHRLGSAPGGPWEAGVQEAMTMALARPGKVYLSGEIPYASYVALFAERTDPAEYQEKGMGALRTQLLPPGAAPPKMKPGDTFIGPPGSGQPLEFFSETAIVYCAEPTGIEPRLPVK